MGHGTGETKLQRPPRKLVTTMKAFQTVADNKWRIITVNPDVARSWKAKFG